jgi:hypothetical protein
MRALVIFCVASLVSLVASGARASERRDPFLPLSAAVPPARGEVCERRPLACAPLDDVVVKGLVVDTASPRALVELKDGAGTVVRVGDTLASGRVLAITAGGVVLERVSVSGMGVRTVARHTLTLR